MYNVLIIGAGNMAALYDCPNSKIVLSHGHAFYKDKRFNIFGFVDIDINKANNACKYWGGLPFSSLEDAMIFKKKIDVFVVAIPDTFHKKVMLDILKYHPSVVILEKPITTNVSDAVEITEAYKKTDIQVIVNYSRRFCSYYKELHLKVMNKEFGKFICATSYYGKGTIHNGSHMIDLLLYLLGNFFDHHIPLNCIFDYFDYDPSISAVLFPQIGGYVNFNAVDNNVVTFFELNLIFEKKMFNLSNGCTVVKEFDIVNNSYVQKIQKKVGYEKALENLTQNTFDVLENLVSPSYTLIDALKVLRICENLIVVGKSHE